MLTNTAIHEYLFNRLDRFSSVLEIGSGEGTRMLKDYFQHVTAIEHSEKYLDQVPGVTYIHAPLIPYTNSYFREATLWYDHEKLQSLPRFDAIIIDGPKGSHGRGGFHTHLDLFRTNLYVFDDVHRLWEYRLMGMVAQELNEVATLNPELNRRWFGIVET
jgi:hypothetical protein